MSEKPSTAPYKGVRDFYPEDMAIERYIFDTWSKVAESFGFERYDASILEPAELYRSKGAENAEMVNEQTYTFFDRGNREVTLRPEMTPSVARMVAAKRRELAFPLRWYSIPNLFRYERAQRGRLREHWQLNCDIFGSDSIAADVEIILLASEILKAFGAREEDFEIRINDRGWLREQLASYNLDEESVRKMYQLLDRKEKIENFDEAAEKIVGKPFVLESTPKEGSPLYRVIESLQGLGVTNVVISPSTVRGFEYYTGTIFEAFDKDQANRRSLLGGGRYDNLASLFENGADIPAVGFAVGDVTMRDFLETHGLLEKMPKEYKTRVEVMVLTSNPSFIGEAERLSGVLRKDGIKAAANLTDRKLGDQIHHADKAGALFVLPVGENEKSGTYKLKRLKDGAETVGSIEEIVATIKEQTHEVRGVRY